MVAVVDSHVEYIAKASVRNVSVAFAVESPPPLDGQMYPSLAVGVNSSKSRNSRHDDEEHLLHAIGKQRGLRSHTILQVRRVSANETVLTTSWTGRRRRVRRPGAREGTNESNQDANVHRLLCVTHVFRCPMAELVTASDCYRGGVRHYRKVVSSSLTGAALLLHELFNFSKHMPLWCH